MDLIVFACIVCIFNACSASHAPTYSHECLAWDKITTHLQAEPNVDLKCQRNGECSGLDCDGKYNYKGPLAMYSTLNVDFCMGMVLDACSHPTSLQMYIVIFQSNGTSTETNMNISRDGVSTFPLKGTDFELLGSNTGTAELQAVMNHTTVHNQPHIYLSMEIKIKLKVLFGVIDIDEEVEGMEVTLVPGMYIPVPVCNLAVGTRIHKPNSCSWSAVSNLNDTKEPTVLESCTGMPNSMALCGNNQHCDLKLLHCSCLPNYEYKDPTGCVHTGTLEFDTDASPTPDSSAGTKSWVVIVCSIIGALVLLSIVIAVVIKVRRFKARYSRHQLVLSEDPEDDPEV